MRDRAAKGEAPELAPGVPPGVTPDRAQIAACLGALKAATAAAHARIEASEPLARLTAATPTLSDYRTVLERFYLHFARHEPGILRALANHLPAQALAQRTHLAALRADLADLGGALPAVTDAPAPGGVAEAAGWLYVHEGASLGGLVVLRGLRASLGAALGPARRFYQGHGRQTAARWRETQALIAGLIADPVALGLALAGASRAFETLHQTMQPAPFAAARRQEPVQGCPFRH